MQTKAKITLLSCLTGVLAVLCAVSLISGSSLLQTRGTSYTWLDPKSVPFIDEVTIQGADSGDIVNLRKKDDGSWLMAVPGEADYPVKQSRIDDLFASLSKTASYPVRAASDATDSRLGITEAQAARITVKGKLSGDLVENSAESVTVLDLLVGNQLVTEESVYLKKAGDKETRSGDDLFTTFTTASRTSWFDLRIFGDYDSANMGVQSVQRLIAYAAVEAAEDAIEAPATLTVQRASGQWQLIPAEGEILRELSTSRVDNYVRTILDTTGEDFVPASERSPDDPSFGAAANGRVVLEYGNGERREVRLGPKGENGTNVIVSGGEGKPFVYRLSDWSAQRLFRKSDELGKL